MAIKPEQTTGKPFLVHPSLDNLQDVRLAGVRGWGWVVIRKRGARLIPMIMRLMASSNATRQVPIVAVASVTVAPTTAALARAATRQLVLPAGATNKAVTYSTSAAAVATVSASGMITAVAAGTANITVTTADGAKTAVCVVTVA